MFYKGYRIIEQKASVKVEGVGDFDPVHTFECGQCFRWIKEEDGSYTGVVGNKVGNIKYGNGILEIRNSDIQDFTETWFDYLDLGRDYSTIKKQLKKDEIMEKAIVSGQGIRILKQDLWETLISFIISANNRIPMIMKVVDALSSNFGNEMVFNGKKYYTFPERDKLYDISLDQLEICKGGFRCKYILNSTRQVVKNEVDLRLLDTLDTEGARSLLTKLPGVGEKVADCTLLYSGTKHDVFPTDVWVKRVMEVLYFKRESNFKEIQSFASEYFGELAGFAQQYLFYYARENRIGAK